MTVHQLSRSALLLLHVQASYCCARTVTGFLSPVCIQIALSPCDCKQRQRRLDKYWHAVSSCCGMYPEPRHKPLNTHRSTL